ncbi:DUF58 domain-containing protein [Cryobacterium levicorallinum]|uniref:DUF58 domain-containing protein n=1 Tax=Cryobacterium levicorallinum TaxID=995038 RepID=A0A1I3AD38_9MICO|nr:DUF58 domain-containing protein [Cryobacterium levicorallinum]TFB86512.1 DUF58 domain-containing protein [Cryobacterium levicorallinum]GEP26652.1 hypothetical protein CLE01_12500 [Cryobacterium levicorallinum]SFH48033.1 Uncharacterized conserved protein, DUF58 family, contains vWF domain [Cryobacterium levicorallinum]
MAARGAGGSERSAWLQRLTAGLTSRLTRRGGVCLMVGAVIFANAVVVNSRDLLFVASMLIVAPLIAVGYVSVRPARVEVTRTFRPPILSAGGESVVSLHLRNLSARPLSGARWGDTPSPGITTPPAAILPLVSRRGAPGDSVRLEYALSPRQRGVYAVGPLGVSRHDPFGFAHGLRLFGEPHDLIVTPRVMFLPGGGLAQTSNDGSIRELLRQAIQTSDELIAREYRPGDALRRVNWPATARHGEIMVRQEEQRSNPEARIVLDTTLAGAAGLGPGRVPPHLVAAFELEVELAASVGVHLIDAGYRLEVIELGASQLVPGGEQTLGGLHGDVPASYRALGGDRALLEGLASVVPVPWPSRSARLAASRRVPVRAALRGAESSLPTFALLVSLSEADVDDLVALARHCDPAITFVQRTVVAVARERLQEAGWRCLEVASIDDLETVWNDVNRERGPVHD